MKSSDKSSSTLTSLAILKVTIDRGGDYLEYLRPFVLQILVDITTDAFTDLEIQQQILEKFGLKIPERTIQIVLKRIARQNILTRKNKKYHVTGSIQNPQLHIRQIEAAREIGALTNDLYNFSQSTHAPMESQERCEEAICSFLSKFEVSCLRAHLRGTTIPTFQGEHETDRVLVSNYVRHIHTSNPERFNSFMVFMQGHMLANALTCPDLKNQPSNYRKVTFYLDTPFAISLLNFEEEAKYKAAYELVVAIRDLDGKIAIFSHSRDELYNVITNAAQQIATSREPGSIICEARRRGISKSDLLLRASNIDEELSAIDVRVHHTPLYHSEFQIDEDEFGNYLDGQVSYSNPRAREHDINSVRSIYMLRESSTPQFIEKAKAVLVTTNSGFANAAQEYGQEYESPQGVSSVITDFALANKSWLKRPLETIGIPKTQLLAFAYAALEPSPDLLSRYMSEIDRLEHSGKISARDHQLLRSSTEAYAKVVHFTSGDASKLGEPIISETLKQVLAEIRREETDRLTKEEAAHRNTQAKLHDVIDEEQKKHQDTLTKLQDVTDSNHSIIKQLASRCRIRAKRRSWATLIFCATCLVALETVSMVQVFSTSSIYTRTFWGVLLVICTVLFLFFPFIVKDMRPKLSEYVSRKLLRKELKRLKIDFQKLGLDIQQELK